MASTIRVLDESLIGKIAAGEVVERPASVVKELVENSIDAGATKIRVEIKAGGKQSIVVTDDGSGMSREDIALCTRRHATSKMASVADLFRIQTLGFRGEALASIGAVAHLVIESRAQEDEVGTRLVVEGGIEREMHSIGRARGTTIVVKNLFFNTPARRKFLRSVDVEARHVAQTIIHLAAGYPALGFELEHQERQVLNYASATRRERAAELLGLRPPYGGRTAPAAELLDLAYEEEGLKIEGVLAGPEHCGRSKGKQYLIVQGRPISSRLMATAVQRCFEGLLPEGHHPVFMLWIDMDPRKIDVNVHPTKREIRLANEGQVVAAIENNVRQTLRLPDVQSFVYASPRFSGIGSAAGVEPVGERDVSVRVGEPAAPVLQRLPISGEPQVATTHDADDQLALTFVAPAEAKVAIAGDAAMWQVHNQYILVEVADGLLFVDQQAAHERINYDRAMAQMDGVNGESQQLLFPIQLEMGAADFAIFNQVRDDIAKLGFGVRDFGSRTVLVEAVPTELDRFGEGEVFYQLLNDVRDGQHSGRSWREALVLAYTRKASIGKGQKLNAEEMAHLISELLKVDSQHISPTDKPIMARMKLSDMERLLRKL
ncbi:MAG: DNA mismatch repair endonuclease MutL [Gemmatimonadetes bacterium]|nr:DNA mismatch repair endonuclease MutL [Gemmatimonadota bacterium]